jgi:alcohol dehydrogenase
MATKMKAAIFVQPGRIVLDEKNVPEVGPLDALLRITTIMVELTDSCDVAIFFIFESFRTR